MGVASGQDQQQAVHGPAAAAPLDAGQGRVSDLALRLVREGDASSSSSSSGRARSRESSRESRASTSTSTTSNGTRQGQGRRPPPPALTQNADIPPVTFPGGRNPYLDRPLPVPPSNRNTLTTAASTNRSSSRSRSSSTTTAPPPVAMTERPSTSSGPGSSRSASASRPNFDKRMGRDREREREKEKDREMEQRAYAAIASGTNIWLLAPDSPQVNRMPSPSPAPLVSPPHSSASGEIQIGMALGSPARDSPYSGSPYVGSPQAGWQPQSQRATQITASPPLAQTTQMPAQAQMPTPPPEQPKMQRTKTQKRRLFGSLFGGRKQAEPPKAVEPIPEASGSTNTITTTVTGAAADPTPARSNTVASKKAPKHKPIIIRSRTEPPPPPVVTVEEEPSWPTISAPIPSLATLSSSSSSGGLGLLSVDIPDIRLERYSVMFSGVLNPNGTPSTKASLLERRQATLEKLKTISDRVESEELARPRRATSPQPMKSPAFSLFPQTPTRHSGMASTSSLALPPRGLTRSNTSPAYLPSPSRATFDPAPQQPARDALRKDRKTVTIISPRAMDERNRAAQLDRLREQQKQQQSYYHPQPLAQNPPTTTTTTTIHFHPNASSLLLDSPTSVSPASSSLSSGSSSPISPTSPIPARRPALRPNLPEPEWQILTPPSSTGTTTSSSLFVSSSSSTRPSLDNAARVSVDEQDAALKAAVEISIARQISMSRQQRRLLRPFG
ncbi:hypothetical protein C8A05DRAFT_14161, partial [Staphylotrichum tortipilum]